MKKTILSLAVVSTLIFVSQSVQNSALSNGSGAPPGRTGSPDDGKTCSDVGCHASPATELSDLITSNVPLTGYVGGETYTITASVTDPEKVKFGFQISPQDDDGALQGSLTITDATRTKIVSSKYVTHTSNGTAAVNNTSTWSFNWVAPVSVASSVTFYGAFNFTNNNNSSSGDVIHTSTLTIPASSSSVNDPIVISSLNLYPNPANEWLNFSYYLQQPEQVTIELFDVNGKKIVTLLNELQSAGPHDGVFPLSSDLSSGVYVMNLKAGAQLMSRKVMVM